MEYKKITIMVPPEALPALEHVVLRHHVQGWIEEEGASGRGLVFFVPSEDYSDHLLESLDSDPAMPRNALMAVENLAGEEWERSWKEHIRIQKAGCFVVKPTWESYAPGPGEKIIELDPGMAFGTGDHATTALCLELIDRYMTEGASVIDFGTGSGILALASLYRGAHSVMAIDHDPVAIAVAHENLVRLGLRAKVDLVTGEVTAPMEGVFDMALANIFKREVIELISMKCPPLRQGGLFIASGITTDQVEAVEQAVYSSGWQLVEKRTRDLWGALVARKQ